MKKNLLLLFVALVAAISTAYAANDVITFTWQGSATDVKEFQLKTTPGKTFMVDWGDGSDVQTFTGTEMYQWVSQSEPYGDENMYSVSVTAGEDCRFIDLSLSHRTNNMNNEVTELNVSESPNLTHLYCLLNRLTELDVTNNTELVVLSCYNNQITELDVSNNTKLEGLFCYVNKIPELDVSNCMELIILNCGNNLIAELNVSNSPNLTLLYCNTNQLSSLDVSNNTALTDLRCNNNLLTLLIIGECEELGSLWCNVNQLTELDVSGCTALGYLNCSDNLQLGTVDISNNTALTGLDCNNAGLTALDISNNTLLTFVNCYNNEISKLDTNSNTLLTDITCTNNQLTSLDLSNNMVLKGLVCRGNKLTSLDTSNNPNIDWLSCSENQLPLSDLYIIGGNMISSGYGSFGQQLHLEKEEEQNKPYSLSGEMILGETETTFSIVKGNDDNAVEGTDYTLDYNAETITFLLKGDYTATLTNSAMRFSAIVIIPFKVTDGTGIANIDSDLLSIYPNPATKSITVNLPGLQHIEIYNLTGKCILGLKANSDKEEVEVQYLAAGIYLVKLFDGKTWQTRKIVKK